MSKIKIDNKSKKILNVQFSNAQSFQAAKSAIASSSYEGFKPKVQSIRMIRDVVEGRVTREQLILSLKSGSVK